MIDHLDHFVLTTSDEVEASRVDGVSRRRTPTYAPRAHA